MGLDFAIICEFTNLERKQEETDTVAWTSLHDAEFDLEIQASLLGAKYCVMPRKRGKHRWEIREPGEFLVVLRLEKVID